MSMAHPPPSADITSAVRRAFAPSPANKFIPHVGAGVIKSSHQIGVAMRLGRSGNPQTLSALNPNSRGKSAEILECETMIQSAIKDVGIRVEAVQPEG